MSDPYVIVGAGHAARRAAETLRALAPDVRVLMIGEELDLPYDRPVLSKEALLGIEGEQRAFIRDAAWYAQQRIELRLGQRVDSIDRSRQCVVLDDGEIVAYAKCLIATGSSVRRFSGPVDSGANVHYVRTIGDARALREALVSGARVVVLGGGFIGLEVAASAVARGCSVTLVEPASGLLKRSMPTVIGEFMAELHRRKGVDLRFAETPLAIGHGSVETDKGELAADVVVIGIGVVPNVELAVSAGLDVENGIVVDEQCRTRDPSIFAAGEVTSHFNPLLGRSIRVESWQVAENQPVVAAANMLGGSESYSETPWLWSDQYGSNIQTLGIFTPDQRVIVRRNASTESLCVLGVGVDGRLEAVAAVNQGREIAVCRRLIAAGKVLDPNALADPEVALKSLLR